MKDMLVSLYFRIRAVLSEDDGQDLVEYALLASLIALGCCAGMNSLAAKINSLIFTEAADIIAKGFS